MDYTTFFKQLAYQLKKFVPVPGTIYFKFNLLGDVQGQFIYYTYDLIVIVCIIIGVHCRILIYVKEWQWSNKTNLIKLFKIMSLSR